MAGKQEKLSLGNMDAKRDWGFAGDYVEGMWRILQQNEPKDYVLATNETHTVREFVELAFSEVGVEIEWQGTGVEEKGVDKATGKVLVDVNPRYFRPAEVELLWGDSTKAENELGWERKVNFKELVSMMVDSDMREIAGIGSKEFETQNKLRLPGNGSDSVLYIISWICICFKKYTYKWSILEANLDNKDNS